jgi:uncharacterized membrane protein YgcG
MSNNTIRNIVIAVFVMAFLMPMFASFLAVLIESGSNPVDYVRITDVDYKAVVVDEIESQPEPAAGSWTDNSDDKEVWSNGKIIITERLTFEVYAASRNNPFWELWRDLPETMTDGVLVDYKINSVKQILPDGSYVEYQESPILYWDDDDFINTAAGLGPGKWYHSKGPYSEAMRQYECVLFYVDGLYRETVVFEIEYEMNNAALRYGDSSELYIALYSGETVDFLKRFRGQILIPNDKMPQAGNYEAYTCGTNTNTFPFTESATANPGYHTFSFTLDEKQLKFKSYNQYIEFVLIAFGEDKHKFTQYASKNAYYDKDVLASARREIEDYLALPGIWQKYKAAAFLVLLAAAALLTWLAYGIVKGAKRKNTFYESAQDIEFYRDIPSDLYPYFAAVLAFCKISKNSKIDDGFSAAMLSLIHKGYIELERIRLEGDWKNKNMKIVVKPITNAPQPQPQPLYQFQPDGTAVAPIQTISEASAPAQAAAQTSSNLKPFSVTEQLYYDLIRRHAYNHGYDGEIALNVFQNKVSADYEYTASFLSNVKDSVVTTGVSQGYFQKHDYKKPSRQVKEWLAFYVVIGILLMLFGNLISYPTRLDLAYGGFFIFGFACFANAIYLSRQSRKLILLSQFGADEYAKWRGLYNFLNSETLMKEKTFVEVVIWEKYLIYATAFGIAEKVIKALKVRCPEASTSSSSVLRNPYIYASAAGFHSYSRSFGTATRTASYASGAGGHSGGYGGGGRGGGGGGGGH